MKKSLEEYKKRVQEVYDHLGFIEDKRILPFKDLSEQTWAQYIPKNGIVHGGGQISEFLSGFSRSFYEGEVFTGALIHHDGSDVIAIFHNEKRLPTVYVEPTEEKKKIK